MKNVFLALLLFIALPFAVASAKEDKLALSFFGPFIHSKQVPNALFLLTDISYNDSWELRRALRTHNVDTIILASNGGSVAEGLRMAGIIYDRKLTTYVPNSPGADACLSACAFMFFAGRNKSSDGQLGVHQVGFYGDNAAENNIRKQGETLEHAQYTTSEIIGFLNEFKTPPWVYERMFRSKEIYTFTADEKIDLSTGEVPEVTKAQVRRFLSEFSKYVEALIDDSDKKRTLSVFNYKDQAQVKDLQIALNEAKCAPGVADGIWGRKTNFAALRFAKTNKLTYENYQSIDKMYLEKLYSDTRVSCPPLPKTKTQTSLAGNWSFDSSCRNGPVKGWAQIDVNKKEGDTYWYYIKYKNNFNQTFQGVVTHTKDNFFFTIEQTNGPSYSKGSGRVSSNRRTLQGLSDDGCSFQARKR